MARARNIKPALFKNELLGVADPLLTLLFQSLWMLADKEGRLEDRPLRIKAETFPYRDCLDINGYLTELQRLGFILRYSVAGMALIQVVNFKKHQTPHHTEKPSELPAYVENNQLNQHLESVTVKSPLQDCEIPEPLPPDSLIPDSLIPDSLEDQTPSPKKPARFDPLQIDLPDCITEKAWTEWIDYRRKRKLTTAQPTMKAQIANLTSWHVDGGHDPAKIIHTSIANGWQGLFEPKQQGAPPVKSEKQAVRDSYAAQAAEARERMRQYERPDERDITSEADRVA